jgi:hypothetical protein
MPKVRAGGGKRWVDRASIASEEYKQGVQNPRKDWAQATAAAADNQALGAQAAIADGRFAKGVTKAGTNKWRDKAISQGATRFVQGVQGSQPDYETGIKPYLDVIEATTLPTRYNKGDPRNLERVRVLNVALRNKKTGG